MHLYQQALPIITDERREIAPHLAALIYLGVAAAQAQLTRQRERGWEASLDTAKQLFSQHPSQRLPYVDLGSHHLHLWESLIAVELGNFDAAANTFAQVETLPPDSIPERLRLEIINHQSATAIAARNMDEFERYLIIGAHGATTLGSQKRWQEVIANWRFARQTWPHERRVLQLREQLILD